SRAQYAQGAGARGLGARPGLLPDHDLDRLALLRAGVERGLAHGHGVGAAALDPDPAAAGRHGHPVAAVRGRHRRRRHRPRAVLRHHHGARRMSPLEIGLLVGIVTILVLSSGIPIAFGLGIVAVGFLLAFEGTGSLLILGETFLAGISQFGLVAIPMFILMGAAVASSPAGRDLYEALDRWLTRVPGGLVISNLGACALFAALSGSSPATCAAIGKMGIPEMRSRGYPDNLATGAIAAGGTLGILIPPSVTMIVYGIATETSIGRLFLAGIGPGIMLTVLFMLWALFSTWRSGWSLRDMVAERFSLREKLVVLPRVLPFLLIVIAILYVLYGGVATPSEAAGVGALFVLIFVALIYRVWQPRRIWDIFHTSTRESVMIMMIIAASEIYGYTLSSLFVTQSVAEWIAALEVNRWVLLGVINLFLLVAGF